jgi:general secretion pathway protein K
VKAVVGTWRSERGLALVSVLWAMSILSLIAASMMSTGTLSVAMERNALRRAQSDALADSAIALGILGLLDPRPDRRWRVDGVRQSVSFAGVPMTIAIQDEYGLIDLNQADVVLFRGLFRSAGLKEEDAQRLADRVIEWRSAADARATESESAADYRRAGLSYAPRRGPFQSVDELRLVLGMTPQIFARVEHAFTVYSQQPSVDQRFAPREVLMALPGMDGGRANAILAERRSAARNVSTAGFPIGGGVLDPSVSLAGHAFTITVAFKHRDKSVENVTKGRLTGDAKLPYLMLTFQ